MEDVFRSWKWFFLEITNRCNFDCLFCPSGISQRPKRDMGAMLALGVIDRLAKGGFEGNLYLHVLGEPLLHPSVYHLVDHAAEAGLRPVLFTNGGALTEQVVENVLASRAHELVVSMQTINQPSYDLLRRTPLAWDAYRDRIAQALGAAQRANGGPTFRVSVGVKKLDPAHPQALYFVEHESPEKIKRSLADVYELVPDVSLDELNAAIDTQGIAGLPSFDLSDRLRLSVKPMGNWRAVWQDAAVTLGSCRFFGREMAALSDGSLTFCHLDYDGRTAFANLRETSLVEAISDPKFVSLRESFMSGQQVPEGCGHCKGVNARAQ